MTVDDASRRQGLTWLEDHGDALYRYALALVRDSSAAEELLQETFLAALKGAGRFEGRSSERTWLMGILRHKILDHFRRVKRQAEVASDEAFFEGEVFDSNGKWLNPPGNWPQDPHAILIDVEFQGVLNQCLDRLPAVKRAVILMRAIEGLSSDEVCKALEISTTNLWVLAHRARNLLRACLEENWFKTTGSQ